ncbi:MAG: NADP-dependent methylenetetrahydromethanopterin/methylenetetrahydrofolate dehydrogenase [Rubripirellula sp.]|nr:NADP-dependent methylenetetrahydromethanopterin/methylenetetrahydrofolate dehydrogenase [Rubripirellula sp.]
MPTRILLQIDNDPQPSSFDSVVAIDAGAEQLLRYGNVQPDSVVSLVHGAMFTRGGEDLRSTAIFIGGSNVKAAEELMATVAKTFFGPVRVSVMLDANGCNTTASAAVVAAARHIDLRNAQAVVLGGTGPVGQRVAQLLAHDGARVTISSRSAERAEQACNEVREKLDGTQQLTAVSSEQIKADISILEQQQIVIACGAAGIELLSKEQIEELPNLCVAIDLNAVPPAGLGGIAVTDKAQPIGSGVGYGAIGVGGLKMKTHRAAIQALFESNDQRLDAIEIYGIAKNIG